MDSGSISGGIDAGLGVCRRVKVRTFEFKGKEKCEEIELIRKDSLWVDFADWYACGAYASQKPRYDTKFDRMDFS